MSVIGCSDAHYWSSWLINRKKRWNSCMDLLKYVNAPVSTTAHATAHATHPPTHTQFHLSIFLSFWEVPSKEIKLLPFDSSKINNHGNLQCDFDIIALLLKYFCITSSYVWQPDLLEKTTNGQMVKNGPKTWFLDF